jgi:hypothetical protein
MNGNSGVARPTDECERQRAAEREAMAPIVAERVAAAMRGKRRHRR